MIPILLLSRRLTMGYGVDLVVLQLAERLRALGHETWVAAMDVEDDFKGPEVHVVSPDRESISRLASKFQTPPAIVAFASPFFEVLPELTGQFKVFAFEYGDPTPELFDAESTWRRAVVDRKLQKVYPAVDKVFTGSFFLRHDIKWPPAIVIYCGLDHMPDLPEKCRADFSQGPLKVGTLMRMGESEARYKGSELFVRIARSFPPHLRGQVEFHAAGRGRESDAARFREMGIIPSINLTESEKINYLRNLDVFISCSLWEGFNLPLTEAQYLGTFSMALDTGAHPEVCPFVYSGIEGFTPCIAKAARDRGWLEAQSRLCRRFVRKRFTWKEMAARLSAELRSSFES